MLKLPRSWIDIRDAVFLRLVAGGQASTPDLITLNKFGISGIIELTESSEPP